MYTDVVIYDNQQELSQEIWRFTLIRNQLILDSYRVEKRPTKRSGWKIDSEYQRLGRSTLNAIKPEITEEIKTKVREQLIRQLDFAYDINR